MNGENFTKHTLQILLSVGINYHVLREDYIVVKKPLLIVTGAGNMETVISILSDKDTPKLNEFLNFKETMQVLNSVNSDFVVYPYIQSKKGNGFLEIITSIVATGGTGDNGFNALPVVVAENIPYGYNTDRFLLYLLTDVLAIYYLTGSVLYLQRMSWRLFLTNTVHMQQMPQMKKKPF